MPMQALHRGFAEVSWDDVPAPTRPFAPTRSAAHIDLPLDGGTQPARSMPRVRPVAFIPKEAVDARIELQAAAIDRSQIALRSAHASGFDEGLITGWWRGFRYAAVLFGLGGMGLGVFLVRLGASS